MRCVAEDLFSMECILTKKLVVSSYIVDDFIRRKNPCFCKTRLIKLIRNFIRKLMIYSVPIVSGDLEFNLDKKRKEFLELCFTSSSVSLPMVECTEPIITIIMELLIKECKKYLDNIRNNSKYIPLSEYEDMLEAIITYLEIGVLTINNVYVDCSRCFNDKCIKKQECPQHHTLKTQTMQVFLFNHLLHSKQDEFVSALESMKSKIKTDDIVLIVDGRFIEYRNGILEKLDSFIGKLLELPFKAICLYKFMQVPESYQDLVVFNLPSTCNSSKGGIVNGLDVAAL